MKPGSSHRCQAKAGHLRCHRATGHDGPHTAPTGKTTATWTTFR